MGLLEDRLEIASIMNTVVGNIMTLGQHVMGVLDEPPFYYTIGNAHQGFSDMIASAGKGDDMTRLLNALREWRLYHRREFQDGEKIVLADGGMPVTVLLGDQDRCRELMAWSASYDRAMMLEFKATLVVIPDKRGLLPWEPGCEPAFARQLDLRQITN